jgi:hypothetical protein
MDAIPMATMPPRDLTRFHFLLAPATDLIIGISILYL